jgi:hypothetical protein
MLLLTFLVLCTLIASHPTQATTLTEAAEPKFVLATKPIGGAANGKRPALSPEPQIIHPTMMVPPPTLPRTVLAV